LFVGRPADQLARLSVAGVLLGTQWTFAAAPQHGRGLLRRRTKQQLPQTGDRRALLIDQVGEIQIRLADRAHRLQVLGRQRRIFRATQQRLQLLDVHVDDFWRWWLHPQPTPKLLARGSDPHRRSRQRTDWGV
jgi:hypothetical protein